MSVRAINWAIHVTGISAPQKAVLLVLAYHHNAKTNQCNPSMRLVARESCTCFATVKRAIKGLDEAGFIQTFNVTRRGLKSSNQYRLAIDEVIDDGGKGGLTESPCSGLTESHRRGLTESQPVGSQRAIEHEIEHTPRPERPQPGSETGSRVVPLTRRQRQ